jgi:hypothetical protein
MKKNPMDEWVLRDELLSAFHRWPQIVAFIFVGFLVGLAFAFIWPSSFRATTELSVELNPYRALDDRYVSEFTGVEFRNVDDYKHWQMSQLSIIVISDPFLVETQSRLSGIDPYWESIEIAELREMLQVSWRNAGRWLLSAEAETSEQALEALETWQDVILDMTGIAIANSRELFELELVLRSLNDQLVAAQLCLPLLKGADQELIVFADGIQANNPDEELAQADRKQIFNLVVGVKECGTGWQFIQDQFPDEGSLISDYLSWIGLVDAAIDREFTSIELRVNQLTEEISSVNSDWESAIQGSQGLSASLSLKKPGANIHEVKRIRTYSLAALVGGVLGLFSWFLVFLVKITRMGYK